MKLSELFVSATSLQKLVKLDMPVKKAYEVSKFIISVNDQMKPYIEMRNNLIKKYGQEKDGVVTVSDNNIDLFMKDIDQIDEDFKGEIPEISIDDITGNIDIETISSLHFILK